MRKFLFAAAGLAALGAAGLAMAQGDDDGARRGRFDLFQADSNSDGVLTRAEFDANRQSHFARLDADNNGQLTREEMRAGRPARGEGHRGHRGQGRGFGNVDANNDGNITREEFLAGPIARFERMDANRDGVISADERPQRQARERGERRERVRRDADNNGQISREEFASMGSGMFERLDANNDGRVTREEAEAARPQRHGRH